MKTRLRILCGAAILVLAGVACDRKTREDDSSRAQEQAEATEAAEKQPSETQETGE